MSKLLPDLEFQTSYGYGVLVGWGGYRAGLEFVVRGVEYCELDWGGEILR